MYTYPEKHVSNKNRIHNQYVRGHSVQPLFLFPANPIDIQN